MNAKRMLALLMGMALLVSGCAGSKPKGSPTVRPDSQGATGATASPSQPQDAASTPQSQSGMANSSQAERKVAAPTPAAEAVSPRTSPLPRYQRPTDTTFQDAGENPLINTAKQPTSTFSVDVDTASFTVARQYLNQGMLPPPESVRVEEFINYFPQGYPKSDEPVSVNIEGAPHPFHANSYLIEVGLQARQVAEAARKPALLTFVVDVSGSMDMENRLGLVKRSLHLLLEQLQADDRVGLVVYGSTGQVILEPTSDKGKIARAIEQLQPGGSTNAEEGIRLGYELAHRHFLEGGINRVILCSDGVANVGRTGPEEILRQIEDYKQRGITLTTVGVGMGNYNDLLMEQLADKGDGQYAYVNDLDEARRLFGEQLTGTLQVVAKDSKIQVSFDPEQVTSYRMVGYENRVMANQEFRNDAKDAGEMGAGQSVTALYEVTLAGSQSRLGSVSIRYKEPESGKVVEQEYAIRRSVIFSTPSAHLLWTASVAEFAGILGKSPWAAETSLDSVRRTARQAAADLGMPDSHRPLLEMLDQVRELRR